MSRTPVATWVWGSCLTGGCSRVVVMSVGPFEDECKGACGREGEAARGRRTCAFGGGNGTSVRGGKRAGHGVVVESRCAGRRTAGGRLTEVERHRRPQRGVHKC